MNAKFLLLPLLLLVAGCAVAPSNTTPVSTTPAASTSALAGNWLLSGSLPTSTFTIGAPTAGATVTFDVTGNAITGSGYFQFACGTGGFGLTLGAALTGTLNADRTFTLTTPSTYLTGTGTSVTLSGTAPATAGGTWTGTYTATTNSSFACTAAQLTGIIHATPIADLTGTYMGAANANSSTTMPISLTLALEQGGPLTQAATITSSRLALNGTVQIAGLSCFSKGTIGRTINGVTESGIVEGSLANVSITMDDGAQANLQFNIQNTSSSQIAASSLIVTGDKCAGVYLFPPPLVLQKQ